MTFFAFLIGMCSLVLSIFAIIIMVLMRKNIVDILNKDTLIFSKNFEIKKQVFDKAMYILDEIKLGAPRPNTLEYHRKMNQIYNELLTVSSDVRIADTFISMVKDSSRPITDADNANFKLLARQELGLINKGSMLIEKSKQKPTTQK